jgi:hypothetical protein
MQERGKKQCSMQLLQGGPYDALESLAAEMSTKQHNRKILQRGRVERQTNPVWASAKKHKRGLKKSRNAKNHNEQLSI